MIFADLSLAQRLETAEAAGGARFIEARARFNPESGACWASIAGAKAMFDRPDSPLSQTFGLGLYGLPTPEEMDQLEAFFLDRGSAVVHEVSPLVGIEIAELLQSRGYRLIEFTSVMFQELSTGREPRPIQNPRLRIRPLNANEPDLWSGVSARGWSDDPSAQNLIRDLGRAMASAQSVHGFFALLDEEPVSTGVLIPHEGVALFGGASTVPEARRQGAQQALLDARMDAAIGLGCDIAMMCTAPGSTSQRNAEREGFRIAYTRAKWQLLR